MNLTGILLIVLLVLCVILLSTVAGLIAAIKAQKVIIRAQEERINELTEKVRYYIKELAKRNGYEK